MFPVEVKEKSAKKPGDSMFNCADDRQGLEVEDDIMILVDNVDGIRENRNEEIEQKNRHHEDIGDVKYVERCLFNTVHILQV